LRIQAAWVARGSTSAGAAGFEVEGGEAALDRFCTDAVFECQLSPKAISGYAVPRTSFKGAPMAKILRLVCLLLVSASLLLPASVQAGSLCTEEVNASGCVTSRRCEYWSASGVYQGYIEVSFQC